MIQKKKVSKENKQKKIKKDLQTFRVDQDMSGFIFDESKITKEKHSATGLIKDFDKNDHLYFGVSVPKKIELRSKKGKFLKEIQKDTHLILWDNHLCFESDKMDNLNVRFTDQPLINVRNWDLTKVKDYIEHQGALQDHYKTIKPIDLFNKIRDIYKKQCFFDDQRFYDLHAIWDIGTYLLPIFEAYPYFEMNGLKGTAKTKVMRISQGLTFNAELFVNPTIATVFRFVNSNLPTLYLDECENLFNKYGKPDKDNEDMKQLLNAGWQKGACVPRLEKNETGKYKLQMFRAYCPKMFGSIAGIPDDIALKDRTITQVMIKSAKADKRGNLWPNIHSKEFKDIRNSLYPFILKNWENIFSLYDDDVSKEEIRVIKPLQKEFDLDNRDWLLWKPLLCIAKFIDKEIYNKLGKFAEDLTKLKETSGIETDSWDHKIINGLLRIVQTTTNNEKVEITVDGIKLNIEFNEKEKRPTNSYIGRLLNRIGFKQFRKRNGEKGVYYYLNKQEIDKILTHQNIVTLVTQATLVTQEEKVM